MTTYSTYPIPPIDTLNQHGGFIFIGIVCVILAIIFIVGYLDGWWYVSETGAEGMIIGLLILVAVFCASGYHSYHSGVYKEFANKPMEAELVSFWGEQRQESRRNGKQTKIVTVHEQFVTYKVPEGVVSFRADVGQVWPEKAVLYGN